MQLKEVPATPPDPEKDAMEQELIQLRVKVVRYELEREAIIALARTVVRICGDGGRDPLSLVELMRRQIAKVGA